MDIPVGWLGLKEHGYLPTDAKILSATVSERAGRWSVSLQIEEKVADPKPPSASCGVDVGIVHLAILDDGTTYKNPNALRTLEGRLQRQHKIVSRRKNGSQN